MAWDQMNKAIQMISNLGVILGLVLVAYQMNQNTEALRLQNYNSLLNGLTSAETANQSRRRRGSAGA